jgi:hypothetical protein
VTQRQVQQDPGMAQDAVANASNALTQPGLDKRYAPGEDIRPLIRSIAAGLIGGALVFGLDRLIPLATLATFDPAGELAIPLPEAMLWPALWADAVLGEPRQTAAGIAIGLIVATLAAIGFVYGQFRRFVPGPAWLRGLAWAAALGLILVPALLPRAATWLAVGMTPDAGAAGWLGASGLVLVKVGLGLALYGLVVGVLNPPLRPPAPPGTDAG